MLSRNGRTRLTYFKSVTLSCLLTSGTYLQRPQGNVLTPPQSVHWYLAVVLFPDNLLRAIQDKQPEVHVVSSGEPNQDALDVQIVQQQEAGQFMIQGRAVETPDPSSLPVSRAESVEDVQMSEDVDMREETGLLAVSDHEDRSPASSPGPPAIEEELLDIGDDEEPCDESWKTNTDA